MYTAVWSYNTSGCITILVWLFWLYTVLYYFGCVPALVVLLIDNMFVDVICLTLILAVQKKIHFCCNWIVLYCISSVVLNLYSCICMALSCNYAIVCVQLYIVFVWLYIVFVWLYVMFCCMTLFCQCTVPHHMNIIY